MDSTYGPLHGDMEIAFSKIAEACSCLDDCLRLVAAKTQCDQPAHDQRHEAILLHTNRIKEHAAEIQDGLIALSDELIQSGRCSLASMREQPSASRNDPGRSAR